MRGREKEPTICTRCGKPAAFLCPYTDVCPDCMADVAMLGPLTEAVRLEAEKRVGGTCRCRLIPARERT